MQYEHQVIERKWQQEWRKRGTYRVQNDPPSSGPKYYVLDMFPYPSGAGLHVGHPLGYIASDIVARFKRHSGFNVLHPMGYDSFGLPAEQYAIQTGQHPAKTTEENTARYREQLDRIGFSFDWERQVFTSDPSYYKWTQWIFIQLFESWYDHEQQKARPISELVERFTTQGWHTADTCAVALTGDVEEELEDFTAAEWISYDERTQRELLLQFRLAYLSEAWVNWCPALGTVLANDEVKDGVSERGGHPVERKRMPQWSMRITAYAQRLLDGLEDLDWSTSLKEAQRNWIGRSEGALVRFALAPNQRHGKNAGLTPNPSLVERGAIAQRDVDLRSDTANRKLYKVLQDRAKAMRHEPTEAESILWEKLRNHQLGEKFRRQHVIQDFITDLVCLPRTLIVEVDGGIHQEDKGYDAYRTLHLEAHGFKVIRFSNEDVIKRTDEVLKKISQELLVRPLRQWPEGSHAPMANADVLDGAHSPLSTGEGPGVRPHSSPSLGAEAALNIEVFTTRPDTLFGVTFITLAPEHELVELITTDERREEVTAYVTTAKNRSERDRMADVKKVSGVFTGAYCIHPFTGEHVPVWVGDYVLGGYGTGAVMAVPGGDQRDWNFATHFGLPIIAVTEGADIEKEADERKDATIISEGFLQGLKVPDAITRAIDELVKLGAGKRRINFRLRDAAFGRQRYWGEPIPIYYKDGVPYALPESELPLVLPKVDKFLPTEDGEPPLARAKDWYYSPLHRRGVGGEAHSSPSTGEDQGEAHSPPLHRRGDGGEAHSTLSSGEAQGEAHSSPLHRRGDGGEAYSTLSSGEAEGEAHSSPSTGEAQGEAHSTPLHRRGDGGEAAYPLETTTMPGWAGSSWYFLRYMDPHNEGRFASPEAIQYWNQIDLYMGGSEHATGHLLYFRFWTKFLKDRGWLPFDEPAKKLVNQGMIQGMSAFSNGIGMHEPSFLPGASEPVGNDPLVFVSRSKLNKLMERAVHHELIEVYRKHVNMDYANLQRLFVSQYVQRHIPIELVGPGDQLDIDRFIQWRKSWADEHETGYEFITEEDGTFLCSREVEKMSKSKFNVVNPDNIITNYGADTLRLYEMFLGPLEQSKPWDTNGIEGTFRFLRKFWNLFHQGNTVATNAQRAEEAPAASTHQVDTFSVSNDAPAKPELKILHATLKKVTEDIEKMSFNTSVSQFMIAVNELAALKCHKRDVLEPLTIALAPFAPHITEELWEKLGHSASITTAPWPKWNAQHLVEDNFSYPISFNGKTRMQLEFPIALDAKSVEAAVLANPEVQLRLEGKAPKKVIVVPKRIVNIVV